MKVISVSSAKSIWLFPTIDLNPNGATLSSLLQSLQERYYFQSSPTYAQVLEAVGKKEAVHFTAGSFNSSRGAFDINFTYYHDGLRAETRAGTDVADEFIADLLNWLHITYDTADPEDLITRKIYSSELHIRLSSSLSFLNPRLKTLADIVQSKSNWPNPGVDFQFSGVMFSADPASKSQQPPFRIERDASAAFDDERYWSVAPLQTSDHIELLRQFARVLEVDEC